MPDPLNSLLVAVAVLIGAALLFWPGRGWVPRIQEGRRRTAKVLREDALKYIHNAEVSGQPINPQGLAGAAGLSLDRAIEVVADLEKRRLIKRSEKGLFLTLRGRDSALHILRAHRLWERYLADASGYDQTDWHQQADRREHQLSAAEVEALAAKLGHPAYDPHGDPIPTADGELKDRSGVQLTAAELDRPLQILHIEDEPATAYAQLVAVGLHVGQPLRVVASGPERIRIWSGDQEIVLAPIVAANVTVSVVPEAQVDEPTAGIPLSELKPGERGRVISLSMAVRGPERRRLLDLGLLPGTEIRSELVSPSGDPTAYRIRGAAIALRQEQADWIRVEREVEA
ncbi:MAG: metal-dependent transcriptional regulator [Anaerolineales bacterium]